MGHDPLHCDVAIVGGGAAGTLVALRLLQGATAPLRVVVLEPRAVLGEGVAYSTRDPEHVLNVPAGRMSAFAQQPDDFVGFLQARRGETRSRTELAGSFVPRRLYALYLQQRLQQAASASAATLQHVPHQARGCERTASGLCLTLEGGRMLHAAAVVLAVGNTLRPLPLRGAALLPPGSRIEGWNLKALAEVPASADVAIVGAGLSMADAVLSLAAQGHRGRIHVIARHGLMPQPHAAAHTPAAIDVPALLHAGLRARMRRLRAEARAAAATGVPWQDVMDALRPHNQALWQSLAGHEQRRFLRHVVRQWDVHRHRVAPSVHQLLEHLRQGGQLRLHRARMDTAVPGARCLRLGGHTPGGASLALDVERVINATGLELRVQAMRNPLLDELLGRGLAQAGPHGIGLATDAEGRVTDAPGHAQDDLRAIGSLRIGSQWESLAIPELRVQAEQIAAALLAARGR